MKLALYGYGGHAREIYYQISKDVVFFVDDRYVCDRTLPLSLFDPAKYKIMIAVGDSNIRQRMYYNLPQETKFFTFIHPTALILDKNIEIGEGSFIGAYSVLTTNIKIGKHCLLNRGNHIGHDTTIGDFFSAMPGSIVSGNCTIGSNVYIGTNSSIREKINICNNVTVGLGSGVVKNIDKPGIYAGLPAKNL